MTTVWQSPDGHNEKVSCNSFLLEPLKDFDFSSPKDIFINASDTVRQLKDFILALCSDQCKDENYEGNTLNRKNKISDLLVQCPILDEAESAFPDLLENLPDNESFTKTQDKVLLGLRTEANIKERFSLPEEDKYSSKIDMLPLDEQNYGAVLQERSRSVPDMSLKVAANITHLFSLFENSTEQKGEEGLFQTDPWKMTITRKCQNSSRMRDISEQSKPIGEESRSREDVEYKEPWCNRSLNSVLYSQSSTAFSDDSGIWESDLEDSTPFMKLYKSDAIEDTMDKCLTSMQDTTLVSGTENKESKESVLVNENQGRDAVSRPKVGRNINPEERHMINKALEFQLEKPEKLAQRYRKMENEILKLSAKLSESKNIEKKLRKALTEKQDLVLRLQADRQTLNKQNAKIVEHSHLTNVDTKAIINKITTLESIIKQLGKRVFADNMSQDMEASHLRRELSIMLEEKRSFLEATQMLHVDFNKAILQFKVLQKQLFEKSEQLTKTREEKVRLQQEMILMEETIRSQERIENALKSSLSTLMNFKVVINAHWKTTDQNIISVNNITKSQPGTSQALGSVESSAPANGNTTRQEIGSLRNQVKENKTQLECIGNSWSKFKKKTEELRSTYEGLKTPRRYGKTSAEYFCKQKAKHEPC